MRSEPRHKSCHSNCIVADRAGGREKKSQNVMKIEAITHVSWKWEHLCLDSALKQSKIFMLMKKNLLFSGGFVQIRLQKHSARCKTGTMRRACILCSVYFSFYTFCTKSRKVHRFKVFGFWVALTLLFMSHVKKKHLMTWLAPSVTADEGFFILRICSFYWGQWIFKCWQPKHLVFKSW